MADDDKSGATQDDDQQNDQSDDKNQQGDDLDKVEGLGDAGKEVIRKERERAANASKALKDTEKLLRDTSKRLKDLEDKDKSDAQKLVDERDALREKVAALAVKAREANGREAVRSAAAKLGADAKRLDVIWKIVRSDLAYGDDDEPSNLTEVLSALKSDHPEEFKPIVGKGDGGAGNNGNPKDDPNAALRRAAGRSG